MTHSVRFPDGAADVARDRPFPDTPPVQPRMRAFRCG